MPHGRYPGAIVFLEVPPAEVDVNVHPAKAEVRLADPRAAWEAIFSALTPLLSRGEWLQKRGTALVEPARSYAMPEQAQRVADSARDPFEEAEEDFGEVLRHELNNPLTGILGNAELLLAEVHRKNDGKLPHGGEQRLETIAALAVRLRETVRRLSQEWEARQHPVH